MTGLVSVDTNVLIYAVDPSEPAKMQVAQQWLRTLRSQNLLRLSFQTILEFYNVVTRKVRFPMDRAMARDDVRDLLSLDPFGPDTATLDIAWHVQDRYRFSWWDSLIIAGAKRAGCKYLLTEDLQHQQDLDGLTVISPFQMTPQALVSQ
jgi:predicted nucleic acid-binding protein